MDDTSTTDKYYKSESPYPSNHGTRGPVTTGWQDTKSGLSTAGSGLKSAFNWVSDTMDQYPVFTKWATFGIAFLGLFKMGDNLGERFFGDSLMGRIATVALAAAAAFMSANYLSDWAANKGADRPVDARGNLLPLDQNGQPIRKPGTSGTFDDAAQSRRNSSWEQRQGVQGSQPSASSDPGVSAGAGNQDDKAVSERLTASDGRTAGEVFAEAHAKNKPLFAP